MNVAAAAFVKSRLAPVEVAGDKQQPEAVSSPIDRIVSEINMRWRQVRRDAFETVDILRSMGKTGAVLSSPQAMANL